jgi:hypothetical protein
MARFHAVIRRLFSQNSGISAILPAPLLTQSVDFVPLGSDQKRGAFSKGMSE